MVRFEHIYLDGIVVLKMIGTGYKILSGREASVATMLFSDSRVPTDEKVEFYNNIKETHKIVEIEEKKDAAKGD